MYCFVYTRTIFCVSHFDPKMNFSRTNHQNTVSASKNENERFEILTMMIMKIPSSKIWWHVVWWNMSNVSEEIAASFIFRAEDGDSHVRWNVDNDMNISRRDKHGISPPPQCIFKEKNKIEKKNISCINTNNCKYLKTIILLSWLNISM